MSQSNKERVRCIYIIPFYDNDVDQLIDTLDSILYYATGKYKIICVNDCQYDDYKNLLHSRIVHDEIKLFNPVYNINWPHNNYGSLFYKLYQALEFVVNKYTFDYLIKMDTDALLTGSNLLDQIDDYYSTHSSQIGLLGSYKIRSDGKMRTHWEWACYIIFSVYYLKTLSWKSRLWSKCLPNARMNGYSLGEHVLGGAHITTYACLNKMVEMYQYDMLLKDCLHKTNIGEDIIYSLMAFASGFKLGDFGGPNDPMAIAQKNMPLRKEEITDRQKQIIHSVRKGLNGESEKELRAYFRSTRKRT